MKAVALLLLLALPARAEDVPRALSLKAADVTTSDDRQLSLAGGCWLSDSACTDSAQRLVDLQAENASLKAQAGANILPALLVAALVGLAVGVGGTLVVVKLGK